MERFTKYVERQIVAETASRDFDAVKTDLPFRLLPFRNLASLPAFRSSDMMSLSSFV